VFTRLTIIQKLVLLLLVPALASVSAVAAFYLFFVQTAADTHFTDIAGQQRMRARELLLYAREAVRGERPEAVGEFRRAAAEFERVLRVMEGSAAAGGERLFAVPARVLGEVAQLDAAWRLHRDAVATLSRADQEAGAREDALRFLEQHNAELVERAVAVVQAYRRHSRNLRTNALGTLAVISGGTLVALLLGIYAVRNFYDERRRAERALRASQELTRDVLRSLSERIAVIDRHGTIIHVNEAWKRHALSQGAGQENGPGGNYVDVMRGRAAQGDAVARTILGGISGVLDGSRRLFTLEYSWEGDGGRGWSAMYITPLASAGGGAVISDVDITPRKRMEAALRDSEARLRQIIDLVPDMIFAKDAEGRFLLANRAVAEHYGVDLESMVGRFHAEFHGDRAELDRMLTDDREVLLSGRPKWIPEERVRDGRGRVRICWTVKIPFQPWGTDQPAVLGVSTDITEQKRTEEALRESEARLRQIAENIDDVIFVRDLQRTRMLYVSPAYEKIWGHPVQALYEDTMDFASCIHPEDRDRVLAAMERQARGLGFFDEEYRIVRADGGQRWIHARTFPIRNEAGEVYRIAGVARDVTAAKEAARALERSEQRLRRSQRYANMGSWDWDIATGRVFCSDGVCELLGIPTPSDELGYGDLLRQVDPADLEDVIDAIHLCLQGGADLDVEHRVALSGTEEVRWLLHRGDVVRDSNGAPTRMLCIVQDVTQRKLAEQALAESEHKYRVLMENASDPIFIAAPDGRFLDANRAAEQLLGYSKAEILALRAPDIHPPEDHPNVHAAFRDIMGKGESLYEHQVLCKDGRRVPVEVAGSRLEFHGQTVALGVFRDLTERKEAERQRLAAEKRQRDALVREVHHRIKNHLQGLVGLLQRNARQYPDIGEALEQVMGQIYSMAVVHGLQGRSGHGVVRLCEMVEAVCQSTAAITGNPIRPRLEVSSDRPLQVAPDDAVSVALILNELVVNAVKHGASRAGRPVEVSLVRQAGGGAVVVANEGGPLPAGFDLAAGRGVGTGLSLIRALLPPRGAQLDIRQVGSRVQARLELAGPVLVGD